MTADLVCIHSDPKEAERVVDLVQNLTGTGTYKGQKVWVQPVEIAIISPFREQIWRLRKSLRAVGLSKVDVGSVEVYQGAERRVTILSLVRTRQSFVPQDTKARTGLLFDRKRLCVATTRAQEALIVLGSMDILVQDPFWNEWIAFALRNGCYAGAKPAQWEDGALCMVSAIEASAEDWQQPTNPDGQDSMMDGLLAARMATTALLDDTAA